MSDYKNGTAGGSKAKRGHCKRFWWVYLLVLIVIIVIVVPCIILIAVPKMAQSKVNDAKLTIDGVAVTQTEAGSFNLAINSTITTDGSAHATIAGFNGTMWLLDTDGPVAFTSIEFPETSSDAVVPVNISQIVTIDHLDELTTFNQRLLTNETVNVRVNGSTTVRVSGIARDYPITFSKDIAFAGFKSFAGINVTNPKVGLTQTKNFNATAIIPNPTLWSVDVGNTSFSTYFNNTKIGVTNITNMVLQPGDNEFPIEGDISQLVIVNALIQQPYCSNGGVLPFAITGDSVVNNNESIPWLANALSAFNVSLNIEIGAAVKSAGIPLSCADATNSTKLRV
ncbi:hypothetical protein PFICI_01785 [Pestalotiopsis fici W106-1]|uniref:Uncharacterized protein n=1 Tax=Pestalotiopsis fici (strain W106-1 / CGMCC3.15140) TaxID=1229662 RepID=W3XR14_PESFW|nr:uncharacterized protein PFICI_01785 [Pestalotiopsis fici W106-1]ETS87957.1 hypothetical protein PFICI_01785 [Pestalotiopsis fici W106-1]